MDMRSFDDGTDGSARIAARRNLPPLQLSRHSEQSTMSGEYLATLTRHRGAIALFAFGGLLAGLLLTIGATPVFHTRTSVDIRTINADFTQMRSAAPTDGGSGSADNDANLQTQIKLLQSDTLLEEVKAALLAAPHPDYIMREDTLSRLLRAVHLGGEAQIPYTTLVNDTAQRMKVKPLGLTHLVEITCDSWDAKFAATFCNSVTSTFEQQDQKSRSVEAQKTSDWLEQQAADIRKRAEDAQKKLEAAVGGNGLMLSLTTTTPGEERLRELQEELVHAQSARFEAEAQAGVGRAASPDSMAVVQDNPAYRAYQLKLADLRGQLAALIPPLTEESPKVIHVRSEIRDAEQGLEATRTNSVAREANELSAAEHREQLLRVTYNAQVSAVSSDLQKAAQVSLLRREVDSEQQLYQTLLQRAKEAGFASAMQAATIRVIDAAKAPKVAASPQRKVTGIAGFALGGLFGMGLSFFRDRHNRVFRAPGDLERYLHMHELGVVPVAQSLEGGLFSTAALSRGRESAEGTSQGRVIELTRWNENFSLMAEAYRSVTLSIMLSESAKVTNSFVITSPSSGEGKTSVTSNIGIALSKSKLRVALVDGDMRRPGLHRAFGIDNGFGLRNILRGEVDLNSIPVEVLTHRTEIPNVSVIPAGEGTEDVVELLHSKHLAELFERLSREFDVVVVDTPPMVHMADARLLAAQSGGVILVLRAGVTMHEEAAAARDLLDHDGVRLVGSILNGFDPKSEGKTSYYESYYKYQASGQGSDKAGTAA